MTEPKIIDELLNLNKKTIFDKLDKIPVYDGYIKCNDLFDAISTAIIRDKRLINSYNGEDSKYSEVVRKMIPVGKTKRKCRCFTTRGIARYIHEGKLINYKTVCEYYGVEPIDREIEILRKMLIKDDVFDTKKILKWLFGKRKQIKQLGKTININVLCIWLNKYENNDVIIARKNKILQLAGYPVVDNKSTSSSNSSTETSTSSTETSTEIVIVNDECNIEVDDEVDEYNN